MRGMRFPLRPLLLSILPLLVLPILQGCSRSDKPVDGAAVFRTCASCHQVGRRAGSTPDYAYSPAMKASGIVWNEQTLAAFLRDPDKVVPGTRMRLWGMSDEREVAALLAHLRTYQDAH
jgi:cytochrome c